MPPAPPLDDPLPDPRDPAGGRLRTPVCDLLGCRWPVLLAGMGGVSHWELAAAVARAGGYPTLGMVREDPALIAQEVLALRRATDRPFAVNLIPAATDPALLEAQLDRCIELGVPAFSFFWDVRPEAIRRAKDAGCLVLHQVGTLEAAREAEHAGADLLIAQGIEAGGHVHGRMGALALAAGMIAQSALPVVVAGGIADGRGLAAALAMGAAGVQCGTAFLATEESFAHPYHKARVVEATAADTLLTDVFVLNWPKGAAVRVLANSITEKLDGRLMGHDPAELPREAIAWDGELPRLRYSTDSPLRTTRGDLEAMALFAGQGVGALRDIPPAGTRLARIVAEADALLAGAAERRHEREPVR
ncbi:nitronate monooxygenase family protein [Paralimibaculum aggregatum]|uniref:Nitronate monooxygenase family protein n=1 Tax=Paralimibaculum aggregatum TaxID=3036245 RepID=A0ABQ6LM50_9RHOB|nr:nitronate monooxygenase [Limibaculum sp. NKW23]GMG84027.1 nitronate monooxygenase family protein [Limibaculum sp. NKW23]